MNVSTAPVQAVILAGGSGSRLWPASRQLFPKQFLHIHGELSLIETTINRLDPLVHDEDVIIVSGKEHIQGSAYHLSKRYRTLMEPVGRNTAPAIGLAALFAQMEGKDPIQVVLPADHVIRDEEAFLNLLEQARSVAEGGALVTFGIRPEVPATGFGYIKADKEGRHESLSFNVERFVEKPNIETARQYVDSGEYYWNAGIFMWKASVILGAIQEHLPDVHAVLEDIRNDVRNDCSLQAAIDTHFSKMPNISIDYGVLEQSGNVQVVPSDIGWSDVGSWEAVHAISDKDEDDNVTRGRVVQRNCRKSLIEAGSRLVAAIGLEQMCVVETADAVLVCPLDHSQEVKQLVDVLKAQQAPEVLAHQTVKRPWGEYSVLLESEFYKIKKILVYPGEQLSLQRHRYRSEHWVVVSGVAEVWRGDEHFTVHENESTFIPQGTMHRLGNSGTLPLQIVEVQSGEYVGEDDIERFDDEYGRKES